MSILSNLSWNFVDVFIIAISMALTDQFRQLNRRIDFFKEKVWPFPSTIHTCYFFFSFGFLISRVLTVSMSAASIHDESLLPAYTLYSISSKSYSSEIASTIITYVIVLTQIYSNQIEKLKPNITTSENLEGVLPVTELTTRIE
ncbi:gustatory receptor for sugar taste 64f-like [Copidosoma floridanum]|uniref:gustatory receptor for sugar taste 64f-like n=1 Tax=Copidosoma floridanum TaxID=29053 RepID=UPI000C6FC822|nr:gustatory receptor for sugar taste 64f-like [Copidosoma floridanum]